jgi:hypothetical protein
VHGQSEDKCDDTKDENSVGRFQCKGGEERHIQTNFGNKILHETSNDNGISVFKFLTSKNLIINVPTL